MKNTKELIESNNSPEEIVKQISEAVEIYLGEKDLIKTSSGKELKVTAEYKKKDQKIQTEKGEIDPNTVVGIKRTAFGSKAPTWIEVEHRNGSFYYTK